MLSERHDVVIDSRNRNGKLWNHGSSVNGLCQARAFNEANAGSRVAKFANGFLWILVVVGLVCLFLCFSEPP